MDLWEYEKAISDAEEAQQWFREGGHIEFERLRLVMRLTLRALASKLAMDHSYVHRIETGLVVPSALYVTRFLIVYDRWKDKQEDGYYVDHQQDLIGSGSVDQGVDHDPSF